MEATRFFRKTANTWREERLDEAAWCFIGVIVFTAMLAAGALYIICISPAVDAGALAGLGG
jgi:hypothetical protein